MNKKEITLKMAKDAGITIQQARKAFNSFVAGVKKSLKKGERVTFSGFGSFQVRVRKARKGRNPKTGEEIMIPKKKRVKFNMSKTLKKTLS